MRDVRQFVRKQVQAFVAVGCVLSVGEADDVAVGEGTRTECMGFERRLPIATDAHVIEPGAETGFEVVAYVIRQRLTRATAGRATAR